MASNKFMKIGLLTVFSMLVLAWAVSGTYSTVLTGAMGAYAEPLATGGSPDDYVGSETCKACHEDQFNKVAHTKHGRLKDAPDWKNKAEGCESCHGPGKQHVEGGGDKSKIISFTGKNSKEVSETCLSCHSGKESHNNFRRGEHWRNDVGCTDCHTAHGSDLKDVREGSITNVSGVSRQNPGVANEAMLKQGEPQLCMSCHVETKAQFSKPFHHRVLEGSMTCSDCHNAHGGFETKQTKLSVGNDAACIKCHTNKGGPFVYEHGPLKLEGCSVCHTPHGSSNPKMLKRASVRQLCFECHTGITEELSPQAPSLHNQAQVKYLQCTVCHSAIHGSNSSKTFFR
jgi:DmsE family decaheme c-type cytochrome